MKTAIAFIRTTSTRCRCLTHTQPARRATPGLFLVLALFLCAGVHPAVAQFQALVPLHATWTYAYDGVDQGTNWRSREYDDSTWDSGQTLFGFENEGIYFEPFRTILPDPASRNYPITTYFRAIFDLAEPSTKAIYHLTNWIDDGAVFYINGTEVARLRLTDNPVTSSSFAMSPNVEGQVDVLTFTCTNCVLFAQSNVLAVEVHQNTTNSSDIVFGSVLVREQIQPLAIADEPDDLTVVSNTPARFEVVAIGSYPKYHWYKDGLKLVNQTNSVFQINNARPVDAVGYYVVVTNAFGSVVTSRVARLTVLPDTSGPQIAYALVPIAPINSNKVEIYFIDSSGLKTATANDIRNYRIHRFDTGQEMQLTLAQHSAGRVRLSVSQNWDTSKTYVITVNGVQDLAGNFIKPNSQVVIQFTRRDNLFRVDDPLWSFTGPPEEPIGWKEINYFEDPTLWSSGRAILVCDSTPWEPCMGSRVTALNCGPITHYFRTTFVNSNAPGSAILYPLATLDDGAVFYLNGIEIGRQNMPTGPINYATRTFGNVTDGNFNPPSCTSLSFAVTNLLKGTNLFAVEVHQATDLDVTFGLELDVEYIAAPPLEIPTLRITRTNDLAQVWWPGRPWMLEAKTNLTTATWQRLDTEQVPFVTPATTQQFFQVRQP